MQVHTSFLKKMRPQAAAPNFARGIEPRERYCVTCDGALCESSVP